MLHPEHVRALLLSCLMASGCGELAYEEFAEERQELRCEIRQSCDPDAACYNTQANLGSCRWFKPAKGEACLDAMAEASDAVLEAPSTCEDWSAGENPLRECANDEVTRRRRGANCFVEGITLGRPLREAEIPMLPTLLGQRPLAPATARPTSLPRIRFPGVEHGKRPRTPRPNGPRQPR